MLRTTVDRIEKEYTAFGEQGVGRNVLLLQTV